MAPARLRPGRTTGDGLAPGLRPEEPQGLPTTLTTDSEEPSGPTGISHPRITAGSR